MVVSWVLVVGLGCGCRCTKAEEGLQTLQTSDFRIQTCDFQAPSLIGTLDFQHQPF